MAKAAAPPLTAAFHDVPAGHDGRGSAFSFDLALSEDFGGRLDAAGRGAAGDQRAGDGREARDAGSEPELGDHGAAALAGRRDGVAGRDHRLLGPGRDLHAGRAAAVELALGDGGGTVEPAGPGGRRLSPARLAWARRWPAATAGIEDTDGLSGAAFAFQWVSGDADVGSATGARYTFEEADPGSAVRVRVTFTDDVGHGETLRSKATAAVAPRLRPLTAALEGVPAEHDGRGRAFNFEVVFSEDFPGRLDYNVLKDEGLQATNAGGDGGEARRPRAGPALSHHGAGTLDGGRDGVAAGGHGLRRNGGGLHRAGPPLSSSNAATAAMSAAAMGGTVPDGDGLVCGRRSRSGHARHGRRDGHDGHGRRGRHGRRRRRCGAGWDDRVDGLRVIAGDHGAGSATHKRTSDDALQV